MAKRPDLNINYAFQNAVSYSQYSMYTECQYRWYLKYVKKYKVFKPGIHLTFGTSLHEVLQEYLTVMYEQSIAAAEELNVYSMLKDRMDINYKEDYEKNKSHYSTPEELKEFYLDGVAILDWFKKHRGKFFSKKNTELIGVEVPMLVPISDNNPNVFLNAFIDLVLYEKLDESYIIYDIKTSTRGWGDKEKKDQTKLNQVLLYKKFFSIKMKVPEEKIQVKFLICKRKVFDGGDYPAHRVIEFVPAQGKKKVNDAHLHLETFVNESFDKKAKHNKDREYLKNPLACKYCEFNDRLDLCDKNKKINS